MAYFSTAQRAVDPAAEARRRREEEEERQRAAAGEAAHTQNNAFGAGFGSAGPMPGLSTVPKQGWVPSDIGNAGPLQGVTSLPMKAPGTWIPPSTALTALRDKFLAERGGVGGAPPRLDQGQSDQIRGLQLDQYAQLQRMASGQAPSIADAQRRAAMFDASQSAMGLVGAQPGDAGASRAALRQLSDNARRAGLDASLVKANEISQAQGQIGALLGSTRTADNQLALGSVDASLRSRGLDVEQSLGLGK